MTRRRLAITAFCLISTTSYANFGESCVMPPFTDTDQYLTINTAYGHLVNSIDIKTYVDGGCDDNGDELRFCLKRPEGSEPTCDKVTMNLGDKKLLKSLSKSPDLGGSYWLQNIMLEVAMLPGNNLCLTMPTSQGPAPLVCRNYRQGAAQEEEKLPTCKMLGNSCYDGQARSQSLFNFSGKAMYCLKETLDKILFGEMNCIPDENEIHFSALSPLSVLQEKLKTIVRVALLLYTIVFGLKMVMTPDYAKANKIFMFVMKAVIVSYFAAGLGPLFMDSGGKSRYHNGMVEIGMPLLSESSINFVTIVLGSGGAKGLCEFDPNKYARGSELFAIWDAIDCRIGYYLGSDLVDAKSPMMQKFAGVVRSSIGQWIDLGTQALDYAFVALGVPTNIKFFTLLFGFFMSGEVILFIAGLIFVIVFISLALHLFTTYAVCLVTIYTMAYVSPIFIPMALFERTKAYFDSWLKINIACVLQPAIIVGFVSFMLTMYDGAMYGNCEFQRHDYVQNNRSFSAFEMRLPEVEPENCKKSLGYIFAQYYQGKGWVERTAVIFTFKSAKAILNVIPSLIYMLVLTVLFYYFGKSMSQFAADVTSGPLLDAVTSGPNKIIDAALNSSGSIKNMISKGIGSRSSAGGGKGGEGGDSGGGSGGGSGGASDTFSQSGGGGSGGGASDIIHQGKGG